MATPAMVTRAWINDLAQRVLGTRGSVVATLKKGLLQTCELLEEAALKVSPKSVVTCSTGADAKEVAAFLRKRGFPAKWGRIRR